MYLRRSGTSPVAARYFSPVAALIAGVFCGLIDQVLCAVTLFPLPTGKRFGIRQRVNGSRHEGDECESHGRLPTMDPDVWPAPRNALAGIIAAACLASMHGSLDRAGSQKGNQGEQMTLKEGGGGVNGSAKRVKLTYRGVREWELYQQ